MAETPELDRAIEAAEDATEGMPYLGNVSNHDRTYARALVRELFTNLQPPADATDYERDMWALTIAAILRTVGVEGQFDD